MVNRETIKTRILIISDTHNARLHPSTSTHPFRTPLPSADVLLHCGDLTMRGTPSEYNQTLDLLASIDAKVKLVIAGNHDRTLDLQWMETHAHLDGGKPAWQSARETWFGENGRAKTERVQMLEEGLHKIDVGNGAALTLYTSEYQPEFCDWAFPYWHHQDRFNASGQSLKDAENIAKNPVPGFEEGGIDVVMTHGPPWKRLDDVPRSNVGCPHLLKAVARARPLVHCFGHIHEGWGAEVVDWTGEDVGRVGIEEYKKGGWEKSVKGVERLDCEEVKMNGGQCVTLDVSKDGEKELQRGKQTLMVNAAIMDVDYKAVNAPFLVEIDLPKIG